MVRAIIFAAAFMMSGVALAQDAPPADNPPAADAAPPANAAPAADATLAAAPASADASYPACSAKVQDHCIQGAHRGASHKAARKAHHK